MMIETTNLDSPEPSDASTHDDGPPKLLSQLVFEAVDAWKRQLIDLGGRNNLLYYRHLKAGTLDLSPVVVGPVRERLLGGQKLQFSGVFLTPEELKDAAKRARTLRSKAVENDEERGLLTLHLAIGLVTWTSDRSSATPNAPVLLLQATLTPAGVLGNDFLLEVDAEPELNPTLLHLLETDFGVRIDAEALLETAREGTTGSARLKAVEDGLVRACRSVPGFLVNDSIVLGNFSYAKLPMVRDLERSLTEIGGHTLLSAIAGDPVARDELRARHSVGDGSETSFLPSPADEFLVLDADSSQSFAIGAAVRGADLVVIGPPGTGKSQTISNLIATLIARGKSVLFVAEKRAAIDAVLERLQKRSLNDLILDLHDGAANRKRVATELARALTATGNTLSPDVSRLHQVLENRRGQLEAYAGQLHEAVKPWEISAFEVQSRLLSIPERSRTPTRIRGSDLEALLEPDITNAADAAKRFVDLGGGRILRQQSPWSSAYATRRGTTPTEAEGILSDLHELFRDVLPKLEQDLRLVSEATGLPETTSLAGVPQLVGLLEDLEDAYRVFRPTVFDLDLDRAVGDFAYAALAPIGFVASVFSAGYKKARLAFLSCAVVQETSDRALLRAARRAQKVHHAWLEAGSSRVPAPQSATRERLYDLHSRAAALAARLHEAQALDLTAHPLLPQMRQALASLDAEKAFLIRFPDLYESEANVRAHRLGPLLDEAIVAELTGQETADAAVHAWLASMLDRITAQRSALAAFDALSHEAAIKDYAAADRDHIITSTERVRRAWAERAVRVRDEFPEEASQVARQAGLMRRHMPIRDLFGKAEHVLTAVKPCWVMSPLVVAQVLPARPCFDVVIFDEASQIPPADAASSILRARQAVVAGDPHQLPPTSFFASTTDDEEAEDDQSEDPPEELEAARETALTRDMESILDVMTALLPPPHGTRLLNWHYRSLDERLITFSNSQETLYDWSLTTFPGARTQDCLQHVLVPFRPGAPTVTSSAPEEVHRVVELVLEHAATYPTESLGVIALGSKHADHLQEALRLVASTTPALADLMDEDAPEPLFVKNLERVQGDERDAIILTVGYGKTIDGRMRYQFGPLNQMGGERRLNVAVTRARRRMTLVSSFSGTEMDPEHLHSVGGKMLRDYLLYAESGGSNLGIRARMKPELNAFERDVMDHLERRGIRLVPQFGASSYWIDFAAMHPDRPSEPVLAIEADGASYHSSPSARDRDRLRQEHLERLGWRFHRIWSTDWFRFREREVERVVRAYEQAIQEKDSSNSDSEVPAAPPASPALIEPLPAAHRGPWPGVRRGLSIVEYRPYQLQAVVNWVKSDGRLYTRDELLSEVMAALGFSRRGPRIVEAIVRAIASASVRR